jgi:predicted nucleic acid-binding protein
LISINPKWGFDDMTSGLVLLDNTVLTNFALVDRPDLVLELWDTNCATTTEVMAEYQAGIVGHGLPAHSWENLTQLTLQPAEQSFAGQLHPQLGSGERSCIALAVYRQGLFVCDDAKARREAQRHGVTVTGTIGVLVLNVRQGKLPAAEGNALLTNMITQGYRSPVTTLDNLL